METKHFKEQLLLLKQGDEKAFSAIYNHYWNKLYYVAYQKLQDQNTAEEIVQEVFLMLWKDRETLSIESLSSYLAAMTRYAVYRHLARERASKNRETSYEDTKLRVSNLDEELDYKFTLKKISELSNQLPLKCRLVFQRNKLEDQALKDVAEELDISLKTAEAHLSKALKLIRISMRSFLNFFL